jgi:hypothetical protein
MTHFTLRRRGGRSSGQVLVMACLTFMVLALMMMASFSVSHAVHERVRLQASADANAFTVAVLEARAFNTLAYLNRTIVGGVIATLGLHAWSAICNHDISMYRAGAIAFGQITEKEEAQCNTWSPQHCIDAKQAAMIAQQYQAAAESKQAELNGHANKWEFAVADFSLMIEQVYQEECVLLDRLRSEISEGESQTLEAITSTNAPQAQLMPVAAFNINELSCALEGSNFDDVCQSNDWKSAVAVSDPTNRLEVIESASKAARPKFEIERFSWRHAANEHYTNLRDQIDPITEPYHEAPIPITNPLRMMEIQKEGTYTETQGGAPSVLTFGNNDIAADIAPGTVVIVWRHGTGTAPTEGYQAMGPYEGFSCGSGNGGCFINFRMGYESIRGDASDYGQPATYGALGQDLRELQNGGKGAWEIDDTGTVDMPGSPIGTLRYVPEGAGFAVAKGKTYFHQLGPDGWSIPPNFFDPFWRAKLHPFLRSELAAVLSAIGDDDGRAVVDAPGTSVEGVTE